MIKGFVKGLKGGFLRIYIKSLIRIDLNKRFDFKLICFLYVRQVGLTLLSAVKVSNIGGRA